MSYEPGLDVPPGDDSNGAQGPGVYTPDPFAPADQAEYSQDQPQNGVDVAVDYLPPWAITRAPGTVRTIYSSEIIPIDPWNPVIALLNGDQMAMLNRQSAMRQAAANYVDDPRQI